MAEAIKLLDYQKRYVEDQSRFKFWAASVQIGKSFTAALEVVLTRLERKGLSILLSASERQSKELMEKVRMHSQAMGVAVDANSDFFEKTSIVQHTATYPNGSRIIALPANPDTARGYSGDVVLDEFSIHRDPRAIWAAMFGRVTRGYSLRVLSSFKGTENKFYELAKQLDLVAPHEGWRPEQQPMRAGGWSGHWTDIYMAVEDGLSLNIAEIREALGDEEVFLQEYCCIPMAGAEEFIPLELVMGCESQDATLEAKEYGGGALYGGMDIGRKKDRSVIWILERVAPGLLVTRRVMWLERMPFAQQKAIAREIAPGLTRFSVDSTGLGMMLAEELRREFPWTEEVTFNADVKERMAVETKRAMEDRAVQIPEDRRIRRAFAAVKRYVGSTGKIRFDAARTEQGHADEFWALALAIAAASNKAYVPVSAGGVTGETVLGDLLSADF